MSLVGLFGGVSHRFIINLVTKVYLVASEDITAYSQNADGTVVSGITLAPSAVVMDVKFVKESASYTQELVKNTGSRYINQSLSFTVESEMNSVAHTVILEDSMVAIVKRGDGSYLVLGKHLGLTTSASTNNGSEEDSNITFTLTGKNLGYASKLDMTDAQVATLVSNA